MFEFRKELHVFQCAGLDLSRTPGAKYSQMLLEKKNSELLIFCADLKVVPVLNMPF